MKRIIVRIQPSQKPKDVRFYLEEPSNRFTDDGMLCPFQSRNSPAISKLQLGKLKPKTVSAAGKWLLKQLSSHPAVSKAITHLLALPSTGQYPIYIQAQSARVEALPWETLCHPTASFLTLHPRWPIGRITTSDEERTATEYAFNVPIKVMAVLSALGIPARPEWDSLYAAMQASQLPIKLRVLVSEDQLYTHIRSLNDADIEVAAIPDDANRLQKDIADFAPSILHFFCHGDDTNGPTLQVARREDWQKMFGLGSIALKTESLVDTIPPLNKQAWLVTLNCCNSGSVVKNGEGFSRSLVGKGFPVVIGMREAVVNTDAHLFCHSLYEECFARIKWELDQKSETFEICWPALLSSARERLGMKHAKGKRMPDAADELKQWTLPILYTRKQDIKLRPLFNQSEIIVSRIATTGEIGEVLSTIPGTPEGVLDQINSHTDHTRKEMVATAGAS